MWRWQASTQTTYYLQIDIRTFHTRTIHTGRFIPDVSYLDVSYRGLFITGRFILRTIHTGRFISYDDSCKSSENAHERKRNNAFASQGAVVADLCGAVRMALSKRASLSRILRRHRQ